MEAWSGMTALFKGGLREGNLRLAFQGFLSIFVFFKGPYPFLKEDDRAIYP